MLKRIIIALVAVVAITGLAMVAYRYTTPPQEVPLTQDKNVTIVEIGHGTVVDVVNVSGSIQPRAEVELSFEISGVVEEVLVKQGQFITAGTTLARLETGDLELAIQKSEIELTQREADLQKLFERPLAEKVAASRAKVKASRLKLAELQQDPDKQDELTKTEATLSLKQVEVQKAQWSYDKVAYNNNIGARGESDALQQATLAYEQSLADYNIAVRNLNLSDADLADAQSSLAQVEADLAELLKAPSSSDVAKSQAAVQLAEISLAEVRRDLEQAVLIAPNSGVVLNVAIEPGERVLQDSKDAAFIIADTSAYLLNVQIDEIDVGRIVPGQSASIQLDAFPNNKFEGQVVDIAPRPTSDTSDSIVTYEVTILVDMPTGKRGRSGESAVLLPGSPNILSGMTAYAAIETKRLEDVVVVPNQAIKIEREGRQPIVYVESPADGDELRRLEISLGLRDGQMTQVLAGLNEGDKVIIRKESSLRDGSE